MRIPTTSIWDPVESDIDMDDDPLVSHPVILVTIPIELVMHFLGHKGNLVALLDTAAPDVWSSLA